MKHIFIVGSKGIPGAYGGYETFVDKLTEYHRNNTDIKYYVACKNSKKEEFEYHNAKCFNVNVPDIGGAQAIYYDVIALRKCCKYIKKNNIKNAVVYILACRIGFFARYFRKKINKLGGKMYVNPDGHEWKRTKWSKPVRLYWKISEKHMVKESDLIICDSKNIEKYIKKEYKKYNPKTMYISYGSETRGSRLSDENLEFKQWLSENKVIPKKYYLIVGRFVPENNYETMIREYMHSKTDKDLVIITNDNDKLYEKLENELQFSKDKRIKFVGSIYEQELLKKIREQAYGYIHGHEVGGTNPSLLEALGSTDINLLLGVGFNKEVGEDAALYWKKDKGSLKKVIEYADSMNDEQIKALSSKAKVRIDKEYSWEFISLQYEKLWKSF